MRINYDTVDLGLPSGTLWTKCNLGAEKETESGLWFQWGDTKGYTRAEIERGEKKFGHKNEPYYDESTHTYIKYHPRFDTKVTLDKYDDLISKYMGLSYRMPTKEDFEELLANTTSEWIINYKNSGVNGRLLTSKTNSNTLFILASGYASGGSMYSVGSNFFVWSSSLNTSSPYYAWYLDGSPSYCSMYLSGRWCGFSVRGVSR